MTRSFLLYAALLFPFAASCVQADDFFPIMGWNHVPNDPAVIQKINESGLTIAGFVTSDALDACQAAGLKAIVYEGGTSNYDWTAVDPADARKRATELIDKVRNHPAVFGYYLRDEPPAGFFPGLKIVSDIVKEKHPGAWAYVNLFPNYANAGQLGAATYDEYVEKFVEVCKPPILSYDHYSIFEGGVFRSKEYFQNLESMRRAALKHNLPFWQIVLSLGALNFREPSAADFRFQAYTSLAYGARGLTWFTYFTPAVGNFRNGPIDQFGNQTPTWGSMQNVNLQIGKLAPTLLKLKSDRVYHFGEVPEGCQGPDDQSLVKTIGGPMLVGDFTHEDGTRYAMIVNKDFASSVYCAPQLREPVAALVFISPYSGQETSFAGEQGWLAPGQGVLLKLKK
jgi:hypothetical protein